MNLPVPVGGIMNLPGGGGGKSSSFPSPVKPCFLQRPSSPSSSSSVIGSLEKANIVNTRTHTYTQMPKD